MFTLSVTCANPTDLGNSAALIVVCLHNQGLACRWNPRSPVAGGNLRSDSFTFCLPDMVKVGAETADQLRHLTWNLHNTAEMIDTEIAAFEHGCHSATTTVRWNGIVRRPINPRFRCKCTEYPMQMHR